MKNATKTTPIEETKARVEALTADRDELAQDVTKAERAATTAQAAVDNPPRGTSAEELHRLAMLSAGADKVLAAKRGHFAKKETELSAAQAELTRLQAEADAKAQADSETALQEESLAIEQMAVAFFLKTFIPAVDAHKAGVLAHNARFLARLQTKWTDAEGEGRELVLLQQAAPELRARAEKLAQERNFRRYALKHAEEVKVRAEIEKQAAQTKEQLAAGRVIHEGGLSIRAVP